MDIKLLSDKAEKIIKCARNLEEVFCLTEDQAFKIAIMAGLKDEQNFNESLKKLES